MRRALILSAALALPTAAGAREPVFDVPCVDGKAAGFPCDRVHLLAYLPLSSVGGSDSGSSYSGGSDSGGSSGGGGGGGGGSGW